MLETAVGWFAPVVCVGCLAEGTALCITCSMSEIIPFGERCWKCAALSPRSHTCNSCRQTGSPRFVWITTDYDGLAKELVQKYKFGYQRAAAKPLAGVLADTFSTFNSSEDVQKANYLVVPVPTASSRVRQRGFDHAAHLAKRVASQLNLEYSKVLDRLGQTRQVGTKREARIAQAENSYSLRKPGAVIGRNILLIDDVITTGATLHAVSKILRAAGARHVDALVFAKRL